ncbi:uncharacterized protein LY79DRAFT_561897 [Colletotrichum navitas]|uniref:Uncharacterized protein n=1 Tax=Colletotrichum navitas TaxID=681940 RepID=A0AAD8PTL9_9PEZI|nr:uncharacterized protein LY79DRAFT_561897 [Colletotrichum navitas]KAK1580316.1 hypothetical protein LY79DRAFT_561897 [Colletotrichum navitas]
MCACVCVYAPLPNLIPSHPIPSRLVWLANWVEDFLTYAGSTATSQPAQLLPCNIFALGLSRTTLPIIPPPRIQPPILCTRYWYTNREPRREQDDAIKDKQATTATSLEARYTRKPRADNGHSWFSHLFHSSSVQQRDRPGARHWFEFCRGGDLSAS